LAPVGEHQAESELREAVLLVEAAPATPPTCVEAATASAVAMSKELRVRAVGDMNVLRFLSERKSILETSNIEIP
jgi:hypothetical protein